MAVKTTTFTLSWENGNAVQMERTDEESDTKLIVKAEENGHMAHTMDDITDICKDAFSRKLDQIKSEMAG